MKRKLFSFCIWLLVAASLSLSSCSDKLTREKAKNLIIQSYNFPLSDTLGIYKNWELEGLDANCQTAKKDRPLLYQLKQSGFVTINEYTKPNTCTYGFYFNPTTVSTNEKWVKVGLTDEGKKYCFREDIGYFYVKLLEINVDEITGIEEDKDSKHAIVHVNLKRTKSPFSILETTNSGFFSFYFQEVHPVTINFSKFDDGWRVDKETSASSEEMRGELRRENFDASN